MIEDKAEDKAAFRWELMKLLLAEQLVLADTEISDEKNRMLAELTALLGGAD